MRDKRLANVDKTKQSIYSIMNGYSVFFDLPDDCLCKAAPTSTSAGLMVASFSSGQPRGGVFARERLPAVS